ncbi:MAG: sulfurtransferase complex subunit TusC [Nitrospirae bacterium CG18_big_fil_WC_8_21_14_2_50_70_55]|nr:sulfurtransferase complex subunit TusC [Deltaproteobacteria bacterium]OIP66326.1 MAG: sulfurtransferase TusC [Nitrospirae bacterium CG2_30_70_394]PIQ06499.1 MAG: sulfurtransferase complex subunit TusC [Nitrospirae bacterium CG18_big_fil_WC_8_21_14_2_50_70_55]PIU79427.1 MAG: sulfurtransferase complex subunit TusC [Nitrospirae bacterium CG06_land_8_20_14_3_00_70_43]PIX83577.1 MAG: sulfurtransferase complex subunit TusC [Nitrospirae bacterium CG_4_10_14_3_um_filter_70_108]PJB94797.1 MAG: sulfu
MVRDRKTKIMFLCRQAPYGTIYAYEGLEVMLIFGAFEEDYTAVFVDDGVLDLKKDKDASGIEMKEFSTTYRVMEDYGIEKVYVDGESMKERGLTPEDFMIPVEVVDRNAIAKAMAEQDIVIPF